MKRFNTLTDVLDKSVDKKRLRKDVYVDKDEIELRDKLLDELSSSSSLESDNNQENKQSSSYETQLQDRKIIKLKGELPNLALPDGWIALNHRSGGIVYLHRSTRVCTWARPYYLGKGSVRKHDVPVAAVPCLHQAIAGLQTLEESLKPLDDSVQNGENQGSTILNVLNSAGSTHSSSQSSDALMFPDAKTNIVLDLTTNSFNLDNNESKIAHENEENNQMNKIAASKSQENDSSTKDPQKEHEFYHPQDGLDVVNESFKERIEEEETTSSLANIIPITSSSKLPSLSSALTKSSGFKCCQNNQIKKETSTNVCETACGKTLIKGLEKSMYNGKSKHNMPKTMKKAGIELIDADELSFYLSKLFEFEELTVSQEQNAVKPSQPVEENDVTLSMLECLPYCVKGKNIKENKEWVLNPGSKTPVAILHEYSQAVLKEKPVYISSECENASTPFMSEVQINGIKHGSGIASTKRQAKQIAAEVALEVLLPNDFNKIRDYVISREELECFDKLQIENHNIYELSIKSGLPTPSQLLQECLKRNQGVCESTIHFKLIPGQKQDHRFTISCGKHSAEGPCKNKKIGKQLASQALLMKLHPHISSWGSLLRIYCDRPSSVMKKYKIPNKDSLANCTSTPEAPRGQQLLARLKQEMLKIADNVNEESKYFQLRNASSSICTVDV